MSAPKSFHIFLVLQILVLIASASVAQSKEIESSHARPRRMALNAEVVFNEPGFKDQPSFTVEQKLVDLVDQAANDSSIRISLYQLSRTPLIEALIRASQRGVDVMLTLDGANFFDQYKPESAMNLLIDGSRETGRLLCKTKPCIHFCNSPVHIKLRGQTFGTSCNGLVINHNKFFLFSRLQDGSENVVAQSSSNLEESQMHEYQDLVIIRGDAALYNGFFSYWAQQTRDRLRLTPHKDAVGDGPVVARFFPRIVNKDPVMSALKRIQCLPGSTIRVAEANINRLNFAARLRDLAKQGCDVKVITRTEPAMFSPAVGVAKRLGSNLMILPYKGTEPAYQLKNSIHTKIILIDAGLDGSSERRQLILTGSHNIDFFSLHTNDETLLEIEDTNLYGQYFAFWNRLDQSARSSGLNLLFGRDLSPK